jgi:hypothetical protein
MKADQNGSEQTEKAFSHKKAQEAQTSFFVRSLRLLVRSALIRVNPRPI